MGDHFLDRLFHRFGICALSDLNDTLTSISSPLTVSQCHPEAPSTSLRVESAEGSLFVSVGKRDSSLALRMTSVHACRGGGNSACPGLDPGLGLERLELLEQLER